MAGLPRDEVIDWLMAGDVCIQYQAHRDLLDEERPDLRARIATEGWGARLLAAQNSDGSWGRGFYMPKWTSSHYTLLDLRNLGIDPGAQAIRDSIAFILETERRVDGGMGPGASIAKSDVCVAGMVLNYACYFGMPEAQLTSVVDFLLSETMQDGGFNCQSNRARPHHSSLHSTLSVLEGFQQYLEAGYRWREADIRPAMETSRQFILLHRLFRSDHTGAIIRPDFLRFPYPFRWKYNILRALDHFVGAHAPYDGRMREALDRVAAARRPDGRWNVNGAHPGEQHFVMEKAGQPSRWITLLALRVLRADAMWSRQHQK
jgi:hypothetical protein